MPTYEYECAACGHNFEVNQRMVDDPLTECPACHQHELQKIINAANFHLKGQGWYVTDFRDKKDSTPEKKSSSTTTESKTDNKKDDKKTETKTTSAPATSDSGAKKSASE